MSVFKNILLVILGGLLSGCDGVAQGDYLRLDTPNIVRQVAAYDPQNIYVIVRVNSGREQRFNATDSGWVVQVRDISRGETNTFSISWYERFEERNLLLARQSQTFLIDSQTEQLEITATYVSEGSDFDCDSDGLSNLVERREGSAPCEIVSQELVIEPDMIPIPTGCFTIGSPVLELERDADEGPQRNICVAGFNMSRFEITFAQYDAFTDATSRTPALDDGWGRGNQPVINVSWLDATAFAAWLSAQTGKSYRLPTEAEWEYAARAGTDTEFFTGNSIEPEQANFDSWFTYNGSARDFLNADRPLEPGRYPPNAFGLFDTHGNLWEWTCSEYESSYSGTELLCSESLTGLRSARGGYWSNPPKFLRSANRTALDVSFANGGTGIRLAMEQ